MIRIWFTNAAGRAINYTLCNVGLHSSTYGNSNVACKSNVIMFLIYTMLLSNIIIMLYHFKCSG